MASLLGWKLSCKGGRGGRKRSLYCHKHITTDSVVTADDVESNGERCGEIAQREGKSCSFELCHAARHPFELSAAW